MELWDQYPDKYKVIVTDEKLLRTPCYQVDIENEAQVAMAKQIVTLAEPMLYIDQAVGNVKGNIIGYGLAAIQMKCLYGAIKEPTEGTYTVGQGGVYVGAFAPDLGTGKPQTLAAKNAEGALPRVGIIRIPSLLKGHTGLSLDTINPQIIDTAAPYNYKGEGCLSFPGKYHSTRRFRVITLGFIDAQTLKPREIRLYGLEATVAQHEVDHHDGVLFIDRANIPVTKEEQPGPNDPCPVCLTEGKTLKWKKCVVHNV